MVKCTVWINVLNPVLETWVSASFRGEAVTFYPGSFVLAPNPAPRAAFPLKLVLFLFSGDLSSGYMDDLKQETAKGPAYPLPSSRPPNNTAAPPNRLSTSTSGPRPGCQPSPPRALKLNNVDSQGVRGRSRNSHNGALAPGHVPAAYPARSLYPENLVPSFPRGPSGRYGAR